MRERTPEYYSWQAARQRCNNPNREDYASYGGRGITFSKEWDKFSQFLEDMGTRPPGHTLDRIDVNGDYEKSNCKWSTISEQNKNQRRWYNGQLTMF